MSEFNPAIAKSKRVSTTKTRALGTKKTANLERAVLKSSQTTARLDSVGAAGDLENGFVKVKADPTSIETFVTGRDGLIVKRSKREFVGILPVDLNVQTRRRVGAFGPILAVMDAEAKRIRPKNPRLAGLLSGIAEEAAFQAAQVLRGFVPELINSMRAGVDVDLDSTVLTQGFPARAPEKANIAELWSGLVQDGTVDEGNAEDSLHQAFVSTLDDGDPPEEPPTFRGEPLLQAHYQAGCSFERLEALQPGIKSYPVFCVTSDDDKAAIAFREFGDEYQAVDTTYQRYAVESLRTPKDHASSGSRVLEGYKQSLNADYLEDHFVGIRPKRIERFQHTMFMSELGQGEDLFALIKDKFEEKQDDIKDTLAKTAGEAAEAAVGTINPAAGRLAGSIAEALTKAFIDYVLGELLKTYKTDLFPAITVIHTVRPGRNGKPTSEIYLSLTKMGSDGKREAELQTKPDRVQYDNRGMAIKRSDGKLKLSRRTRFNNNYLVTFEGASNDRGLRLPARLQDLGHGDSSCLIWSEPSNGHGLHAIVTLENEEKTRKVMVALRAVVRVVSDL